MNCHLTLTKRTETGKGASRQLRREGKVPAVLYGQGEAISLALDPVEFKKVLRSKQQGHVLITLGEESKKGAAQHNAIIKDLQYDPISGAVLHADFFEIKMDKSIQIAIPIVITGSIPVGVTLGGVLRQRQRRLLVEGLPADIPDTVAIDASKLDVGQVLKVKDILLGKDITIQDDPEKILVTISAKQKVVEATEGEGEEKPETTPTPTTPST